MQIQYSKNPNFDSRDEDWALATIPDPKFHRFRLLETNLFGWILKVNEIQDL